MTDVPQQDWKLYEELTAESHAAWVRGLTVSERFALYEDLFDLVTNAPRGPGDWDRLERWHWDQKVAIRLRMVDAFQKMDLLHAERRIANDVG